MLRTLLQSTYEDAELRGYGHILFRDQGHVPRPQLRHVTFRRHGHGHVISAGPPSAEMAVVPICKHGHVPVRG